MIARVLAVAALVTPAGCSPQKPRAEAPFAHVMSVRTLVGLGGVPALPVYDRAPNLAVTTELGHHPLQERWDEGAALGTGISVSSVTDLAGHWAVLAGGPFVKLDLTYLFLTGINAYRVDSAFPFRIQLGGRLGLSFSQSSVPRAQVAINPPYTLLRPEIDSFFDVEIPLPLRCACRPSPPLPAADRVWSLVGRGAVDTGVNLSTLFRWSIALGLDYGWDP